MKEFRVIVSGSRHFDDYDYVSRVLNEFLSSIKERFNIIILSGLFPGVDTLGVRYGEEHGYTIEKYPADPEKYGKNAGSKRNNAMTDAADALIAFWDGESLGTKHMINIAREKGLMVKVARFK